MKKMLLAAGIITLLLVSCGGDSGTDPDNGGNQAPSAPHNPQPANGATASISPTLSWQCSDSDGDALTYDLYFGTVNPPPLRQAGLTGATYSPGPLSQGTTYYWRISAGDGQGHTTVGVIWSFTTGTSTPGLALIGSYDTPGYAYDVALQGNYLYVADGASGLLILDVSNPAAPALKGSYNPGTDFRNVAVSGNFAYLPAGTGTAIVNVTNPTSPSLAAQAPATGRIVVQGQYAYATQNDGLRIIDVSDPYNPTSRGFLSIGSSRKISVSGQYAFVTTNPTSAVHRITITNPDSPVSAGTYSTGGDVPLAVGSRLYLGIWFGVQVIGPSLTALGTWLGPDDIHGLAYESNHVYVASPDSGVVVLDVAQDSQPTRKAKLNPPGAEEAITVSGGIVYVATGNAGVQIMRYTP